MEPAATRPRIHDDHVTGPVAAFAAVVPLLRGARSLLTSPATYAALTVLLVCVPTDTENVSASVHVTPADLGSAALVGAAAARLLAGARLPRSPLWIAMAAATLGFGLATVASQDPPNSLSGFVRYAQLFALVPVAVVLALRQRRDIWLVCGAVVGAAIIEGAVGAVQYLSGTGASYRGEHVRAVGTFGALDIMGMSTVVAYGLVVAFGLAIALRGRTRLGLLAIAASLVAPLLLALSRGAVVAALCAVAAMLIAVSPRLALRSAVFGGAAALVLIGLLGGAGNAVTSRLGTIGSSVTAPDRSVGDRYDLWRTAAGIWSDHPVTGVGLKEFPAYRDSYAPVRLSSGSDVDDPTLGFQREPLLSPHNMYLLVLSEQGLVGEVALGGLLVGIAVATVRRTREVRGAAGPPDGRVGDGRLVSVAAVGSITWTLVSFLYSDIGGQSTVLMSVLLGVSMWWAVRPRPMADAGGAR